MALDEIKYSNIDIISTIKGLQKKDNYSFVLNNNTPLYYSDNEIFEKGSTIILKNIESEPKEGNKSCTANFTIKNTKGEEETITISSGLFIKTFFAEMQIPDIITEESDSIRETIDELVN